MASSFFSTFLQRKQKTTFSVETYFCADGHVYDIVSGVQISTNVLLDKYDNKITGNAFPVY